MPKNDIYIKNVHLKSRSVIILFVGLILIGAVATACVKIDKPSLKELTPTPVLVYAETPILSAEAQVLTSTPEISETSSYSHPTPKVLFLTIKALSVALRAGPNIMHPETPNIYHQGTRMMVLEKYNDWFYVEAPNGARGWLNKVWVIIDPYILDEIPMAHNIPTSPPDPISTSRPPKSYPNTYP